MSEKCTVIKYEQKEDGCLVTFGNSEQLFFSYDEFYKYSLYETENPNIFSFEELMEHVYEDRAFMQGVREALKSRKTSGEIRKAFTEEIPNEAREKAIEALKEEQYIDDYRYALSFVKKCVNDKMLSKRMILMQGQLKGLPEEEIEKAFNYLEISDRDTIKRAVEKKQKEESTKKQELSKDKQEIIKKKKKLISFLSSKGYDFELIKDIIGREEITEGDCFD